MWRTAVDEEGTVGDLDGAAEAAVDGVVLEEVSERLGVGEIVDRDDVEVGAAALEDGAEHEAADAAEPVDANLEDHRDGSVVAVPSRDAPRCAASG